MCYVSLQGCLKPIRAIIPDNCLLSPSDQAAVVGGNVLTCQRVVDVVFKAFRTCAASQGCMNNITFGDESVGYYETVAGGAGAVSDSYEYGIQCKSIASVYHVGFWMEWTKWYSYTHDKHKNN